MRKLKLLIVTLAVAVPTLGVAPPAHSCMGPPCDQINEVCERLKKGQCLG